MGALVAYLVRRFLSKVLVVAAVVIALLAVMGVLDLAGALSMVALWAVIAVTHALGFDLFDRESDS